MRVKNLLPSTQRRAVALTVGLLAGLALTTTACGGHGGSSSPPTTRPSAPATSGASTSTAKPTPAGHTPVVELEKTAGYGVILVTPSGKPLYHLASESAGGLGTVTCVGACTRSWRPVLLPAGDLTPVASAALASRLGIIRRPDGAEQVAYQGEPLYTRSPTASPRSRTGAWTVVRVAGIGPAPSS